MRSHTGYAGCADTGQRNNTRNEIFVNAYIVYSVPPHPFYKLVGW